MKRALKIAPLLMSIACSSPDPVNAEQEATTDTVTLVYAYQNGDRLLEFYDAADGSFGMIEKGSMDSASALSAPASGVKIETLSELFEQIAPGNGVPRELIHADARARALRQRIRAVDAGPTLRAGTNAVAAPPTLGYEAQGSQQTLQAGCSSDLYGDQWGAQWFINNYCNLSGYTDHNCKVNEATGSVQISPWGPPPTELFATVFNGDFNVSGTYTAKYYSAGVWNLAYNATLAPRAVWSIHWYGSRWQVSVANACPHNNSAMSWR